MRQQGLSILIVDDNIGFSRRMATMLREAGNVQQIDTAASYEEADRLLLNRHDLVLLDIRLPGKNGISLLKAIRDTDKPCEVIMVSNCTHEYYRRLCAELGAKLFLDKTRDFDLLPGIVKAMAD